MDDSVQGGPWPDAGPPDDIHPDPLLPAPDPEPPVDGATSTGTSAQRSARARVITGAVAVVLAVAGFFGFRTITSHDNKVSASAAPSPAGRAIGGRGGATGTIASVNGSTLTVKDRRGATTRVTTSSSTAFTRTVTGSFADIKVGDHLVATGSAGGTDQVAAQRIVDSGTVEAGPGSGTGGGARRNGANPVPPDGGPGGTPSGGNRPPAGSVAAGSVKSIDGTTLTVTRADGTTATVSTTPATTVTFVRLAALADFAAGQSVRVTGKAGSDGTVAATTVSEGQAGLGFGGARPPAPGGAGASQPS